MGINASIQQAVIDLPNNFIRGRCEVCPLSVKDIVYGVEMYLCPIKMNNNTDRCVVQIVKKGV